MKHDEAAELLPSFRTGSLAQKVETDLARHVDRCRPCREWLAAHDLLRCELKAARHRDDTHPDSDLLALCVIRPEEVYEPDRSELRSHLRRCSECRTTLSVMRSAVHAARPARPEDIRREPSVAKWPSSSSRWRRALAAAIAAILLGAVALVAGYLFGRPAPPSPRVADNRVDLGSVNPSELPEELSGSDLEGIRLIEAEHTLRVSKLTVRNDADVTFNAGKVVAFGDGFVVAKGARMRVGTGTFQRPRREARTAIESKTRE